DISPCDRIETPAKPPGRARVLTDDELCTVWIAADQCGTFGVIVKLLILTGQRRGEIAALQSDFFKHDVCTLPSTLTKNKREHSFPLSSLTSSLLQTIPHSNG